MANGSSCCASCMHVAEDILVLTAGLGAGAGLMYLCDPSRGRARRGRLAGELAGLVGRKEHKLAHRARELAHTVGGLAVDAMSALTEKMPVSDDALIERVRSKVGHVVSNPKDVKVHAWNGVVTLEGKLAHKERHRLIREVRAIAGVERINDCLITRSVFGPGLLIGLAAGLALFGRSSRSHAA